MSCNMLFFFFIHVNRCEIQPMLLHVIFIREAVPFPSLFCQRANSLMRAPQEEHLQTSSINGMTESKRCNSQFATLKCQ